MSSPSCCSSCLKPKPQLRCECCQSEIGKCCAEVLSEERLLGWSDKPQILRHEVFCPNCFEDQVRPLLRRYDALLAAAREVRVFFTHQGKETRLLKRIEKPVSVEAQADREEALLILALQAAQKGCNALVDVTLKGEKVRKSSRQTTIWRAHGVPMQIHSERILLGQDTSYQ